MKTKELRLDYKIIAGFIEPNSSVLDLGCGEGDLMHYLVQNKATKVQGIELSEEAIYKCVEKGLSVFHGDIDEGLKGYPDKSMDYVVFNQSLQQVKRVQFVLDEAFRVGKKVIIGFPNFASIRARTMLFFRGKTPVTKALPYRWHDTPNLRFLSIADFKDFCKEKGICVLKESFITDNKQVFFLPNLFAIDAIFVLEPDPQKYTAFKSSSDK
ncbi:MAG: methionine biosynthesis protein MetW [Endomicrobiales bacterium]|nr:methionine biosynthesis protein MetW [Endomicrobiales bacterium]